MAHECPNSERADGRPFAELSGSGLLWLINRVVFHPRGHALALVHDEETGAATGWTLLGDGIEPWHFDLDPAHEDARFAAAQATLAPRRASSGEGR